ncbi:MAG: ribosome small subunit-dependent GTPase A [Burkholderiaceae bacterium]|jgi:ribosome biogenesis GTPase|nr:ribosome small subunit-dependent GTPase A [Burkholderiaceae bacterium]
MAPPPENGLQEGLQDGLVVASHGRHCVVETADGGRRICHPRGKKLDAVVGDTVRWRSARDEGVIETVASRRNLLYRQDEVRSKSFAANLDQVLILVAAEPAFPESLLARALAACEAARIAALIALNKMDLAAPFAEAWARLEPYRAMGYPALRLAAGTGADDEGDFVALQAQLAGCVTLLLGPSGAGKSTLINRLVPGAAAQTGEISRALGAGRHTTTHTRWYWLDAARTAALIDTPGFQAFGLRHIGAARLAACMPDIHAHAGQCRFANCTHTHEPGCDVRAAVEAGAIAASRYRLYGELLREISHS